MGQQRSESLTGENKYLPENKKVLKMFYLGLYGEDEPGSGVCGFSGTEVPLRSSSVVNTDCLLKSLI